MKAASAPWFTVVSVLLVLAGAGGLYAWNVRVGDPTPDSAIGYSFAFAGTGFMLLAALHYSLYRRSRKRGVGRLNAWLNWHIGFAIIALGLLFMHSFGNFNPRTGTYALYGMIALAISGIAGRVLDRKLPRAIAREVAQALTLQGEDRIESITRDVQSIVTYHTQKLHATSVPTVEQAKSGRQQLAMKTLHTPWDLAYIALDDTPQEIQRDTVSYRFVPDRRSQLTKPETLLPGVQESLSELQRVEHALRREQIYRYMIRYWRMLHVSLALVTIGLTVWHIEYALQLLIPVWLHR
ncbi:MAG: hypothetical protein J2P37_04890 [Ktedonobacteraceae bacterium]|nr:hypothetical protein [Ktedonobacteraceae bacterium]MBO0791087.1 hypothetical protein [Ktedonobacteraceae bacterium]